MNSGRAGGEFLQGLQLEYRETPAWFEEADDVFFTQRVNMGREYVTASVATPQNVKGKDLDGILGLGHEISVQ